MKRSYVACWLAPSKQPPLVWTHGIPTAAAGHEKIGAASASLAAAAPPSRTPAFTGGAILVAEAYSSVLGSDRHPLTTARPAAATRVRARKL